jgi:hypothetical protein
MISINAINGIDPTLEAIYTLHSEEKDTLFSLSENLSFTLFLT